MIIHSHIPPNLVDSIRVPLMKDRKVNLSEIKSNLVDSIRVPLVKDRRGNLSEKDNYHPLAITCIFATLFEVFILNR